MITRKKASIFILSILFISTYSSCAIKEMEKLKTANFEKGNAAFQGALTCKECHEELYSFWKKSRHAEATTNPWFHEMKAGVNFIFTAILGNDFCYNCHGPKELNEGISCEVCHGINDQKEIMGVHKTKYTPDLIKLREGKVCGKCHEMRHPISGDMILTTYEEWENSPAAEKGMDCTDCHMQKQASGFAFHGFSSRYNDAGSYEDDIEVQRVFFDFPILELDIANKIIGHSLPTGGPEAVLFFEAKIQNSLGETIHTFTETFKQSGTHAFGMPWGVVADNRLKAGEIRNISFTVPKRYKGEIAKVAISFKLFSVNFLDKGDVKKARWESPVIYEKTFSLSKKKQEKHLQ